VRLTAGAFSLSFALLAAATGHAQSPSAAQPPLPGFVPPYEISRIVRSAGFNPLAPPLREGTTYVLRATDYHGILLRVVVDARSGAIRAVNRIVPAYEVGLMGPPYGEPPPYGAPPGYGPPSYRPPGYGPAGYGPPSIAVPEMGPEEADLAPAFAPPPAAYALPPPGSVRPASLQLAPPLPRPRPPELAARDAKAAAKPGETKSGDTKPSDLPAAKTDAKTDVKSDASAGPPPVATATPPAKKPLPPAIQD
jgi:hypothetical protein